MNKVVAAVFSEDNKLQRFFVQQRVKGSLAGKWEFPGGKVEEGESLKQAVAREIFEELGISVLPGKLLRTVEKIHYITGEPYNLFFFQCWLASKITEIVGREGQAFKFVDMTEYKTLDFINEDLVMLQDMLALASR